MSSLYVDDLPREFTSLVDPEMSLSSARADMTKHRFRIELDETEVLRRLAGPYERWVDDSKVDDETSGAPQDELARCGYPPLSEVLRSPTLLDLVMASYLRSELFRPLTGDRVSAIQFWLDYVDACSFDGNRLTLQGTCYSKQV